MYPSLPALSLTDKQALLAALESNQLLHLRLSRDFIRMVEDARCVFFSSFLFSPCFFPPLWLIPFNKQLRKDEWVTDFHYYLIYVMRGMGR